jgi:hypothetical protein
MEYTIRNFWDLFRENPNGSISPRTTIRIGGITMSPGVAFGKGVVFGGVDIAEHSGRNVATTEEVVNGQTIVVIHGFYVQN